MCDCKVCRVIREEFNVTEDEEHMFICKLVESHRILTEIVNRLKENQDACNSFMVERQKRAKSRGLTSNQLYPDPTINGILLEEKFRQHEENDEESELEEF